MISHQGTEFLALLLVVIVISTFNPKRSDLPGEEGPIKGVGREGEREEGRRGRGEGGGREKRRRE